MIGFHMGMVSWALTKKYHEEHDVIYCDITNPLPFG